MKEFSQFILGLVLIFFIPLSMVSQQSTTVDLDARVQKFLNDKEGKWRDLNVPAEDGQILFNLIVENKYTQALEIGTSTGHSTVWIAWALSKTGGKLITIEIDEDRQNQAIRHLKEAGLTEYVKFELGDAHKLVKELKGPFDFVFSDADKSWYNQYFLDVEPKLLPGGCFTAHNVRRARGGIRDFLDTVKKMPNYTTSIKGSSYSGVSVSFKKK